MQCPFQVGDDVVCIEEIKDQEWLKLVREYPRMGRIYKIRSIEPDPAFPKTIGLRFVEIVNPKHYFGDKKGNTFLVEPQFNYLSFRPVKKTSIEDFTKFLKKTPTKIETKVPELV